MLLLLVIENDGYSPSPFEASGFPPAADSNVNAAGEACDLGAGTEGIFHFL